MPSSADLIALELQARVARVRINRPEKGNAMTTAMWRQLASVVGSLSARGARALEISGQGEHFSAGADIAELKEQLARPSELLANAQLVQQVQKLMESRSMPGVALIRGACVGGGVGLALCCDLRIAIKDARFALTPVKLGLHYSLADTRRLANVVGLGRAREMLLTACEIDAQTALQWGLVHRLVDSVEELQAAGDRVTKDWVRASPAGLKATRRVLAALDGSRPLDEEVLDRQFLEAFSGDDFREGATAFLEKRAPDFAGGASGSDQG